MERKFEVVTFTCVMDYGLGGKLLPAFSSNSSEGLRPSGID
jgi:hypothetical protein